jgi:hypothetical protein
MISVILSYYQDDDQDQKEKYLMPVVSVVPVCYRAQTEKHMAHAPLALSVPKRMTMLYSEDIVPYREQKRTHLLQSHFLGKDQSQN